MSTSTSNLSMESPSVTVLLGRITEEIGDNRLSQLIRRMLAQAFEQADASRNESVEKALRLERERASLEEKQEELKAEQFALQEQQQVLPLTASRRRLLTPPSLLKKSRRVSTRSRTCRKASTP
ncbi:hypothetical protein N0V84_011309 [Fusarium piperis]|uniref:Uncharacterized protein n=1 Tax=Fusarium piperis TaxID=1435070 RepID=A0A9W8TC68_9HYPO|nr:hypothetical protein N0V84_011309 [Fusarium piperis]